MPHTVPLSKDAAFFYEHAGYSYVGRRECAERLAQAEALARSAGISFRWEIDPDVTSADWKEPREDGGKHHNPWATWVCSAIDTDGQFLDSLGGVDFGRDGEPWGDTYKRVCEAEIALGLGLQGEEG